MNTWDYLSWHWIYNYWAGDNVQDASGMRAVISVLLISWSHLVRTHINVSGIKMPIPALPLFLVQWVMFTVHNPFIVWGRLVPKVFECSWSSRLSLTACKTQTLRQEKSWRLVIILVQWLAHITVINANNRLLSLFAVNIVRRCNCRRATSPDWPHLSRHWQG